MERTKPPLKGAIQPSPIFIALLFLLGLSAVKILDPNFLGISVPTRVTVFVFVISAWIVSLIAHEFGHAIVAWRGGDLSVAPKGYLTLNPFKYTHPLTSIIIPVGILMIGGIGLPGGAVYIDRSKLSPERDSAVSAAGPLANFVFAIIFLAPLVFGWVPVITNDGEISPGATVPATVMAVSLAFIGGIQILSWILNLLPIPPLDGFGILEPLLPPSLQRALRAVSGYGFMVLIVLVMFTPAGQWLWWPVEFLFELFGWSTEMFSVGFNCFAFWEDDVYQICSV